MKSIFVPFAKTDAEQRMVYGYASTEALDSQGEVVAKSAIEEALPDYMKFANIREMHTASAVGKAHEATIDDKGLYLGVKVVDDNAWQKVKEGVYNGFSIGGKIITKVNDTITKLRLSEISLVDRPANPEAVFAFYKGEGMDETNEPQGDEAAKTDPVETDTNKSEEGGEMKKADEALTMLKGFMGEEVYDAKRALDALSAIMYLLGDEMRESENNPDQQAALVAAVKAIKAFIISELQEDNGSGETAGQIVELSDKTDDIAKAGAAISRANKDKLSQIMALCKDLMGEEESEEDTGKADESGDLAKGADIAKSMDMLKSELDLAKNDLAKAHDRIKELEAIPTAPKGSLMAVAKGEEIDGGEAKKAVVVTDSKGNVNEVASLIKSIHAGAQIQS